MAPFATRLLRWWRAHGRHDLPWQHPRTPYRVWVSEIMLQQTRVETVIGYFDRFVTAFPDVTALATAELDDVLAHWSGLGYYARARNLHAAAGLIVERYGGEFPAHVDALAALPGIGRSTAAAIVAQGFDQRAPILDGNVKRVLARHAGIAGWPGRSPVEKQLWIESEARTPKRRAADYTQAIMDLGATLCTAKTPACPDCPVRSDCIALRDGRTQELPTPKPKKSLPTREQRFGVYRDGRGRVLLERRPPTGIWGGLWCLPGDPATAGTSARPPELPETIDHVFSHFRLQMRLEYRVVDDPDRVADGAERRWMPLDKALATGLPRPVRALLEQLRAAASTMDVESNPEPSP
ncbi:A/G-specific adenine glycosylase [Wenzhouxiangella sp. XN79A]|uniref:A/G-specific adenine glycosylase n=1 Tax=Wenzhouxiangella sp. XN79A TaxID=2724193 RepID=UPI00144AEBB5|nr:A/G-specific adenine glycosylase [Wenzhouxiangella sp. XN79A]NKI35968.1 A/G-specific adenine glycosylase [Wenzhouxiangella sp. XN79A]